MRHKTRSHDFFLCTRKLVGFFSSRFPTRPEGFGYVDLSWQLLFCWPTFPTGLERSYLNFSGSGPAVGMTPKIRLDSRSFWCIQIFLVHLQWVKRWLVDSFTVRQRGHTLLFGQPLATSRSKVHTLFCIPSDVQNLHFAGAYALIKALKFRVTLVAVMIACWIFSRIA